MNLTRTTLAFIAAASLAAPAMAQPVPAVQSALTLTLGGDAERRTMQYDCGEFGQIGVDYLNAAPNFLALVPYEGSTLIFVAVMSASGARYAAGNYEWWTKGPDATFHDLTKGADAPPLASCSEINNTP